LGKVARLASAEHGGKRAPGQARKDRRGYLVGDERAAAWQTLITKLVAQGEILENQSASRECQGVDHPDQKLQKEQQRRKTRADVRNCNRQRPNPRSTDC
jgi:hypothetical protein